MDTCICMAETLCCPPETIITTQIQNKKLKIYIGWEGKYFSGRPLSLSRKCPGSVKVGCLNVKILQDQKFKGKKMKWHFKVLKKNLSIHYTQPKKKKVFQKSMRHTFLKKKKGILIVKHLYLKKDQRKS